MGIFSNKNPGEPWTPEPAARYNAVNDLVAAINGGAEELPAPADPRGAVILNGALASSGAAINVYMPVAITAAATFKTLDPAGTLMYVATIASGNSKLWGVAQAQVVHGNAAPVIVQGLTPVVAAGAVNMGDPLVPTSGGVISGAGGGARALTGAVASGTVILAQLGVAAAEPPTYSSYFKLSLTSTASGATVTIADGATGSNSIAVVNGGSTYSLPPYTETVSTGTLMLLKYIPDQYGSGGAVVSGASMAISSIQQSGSSFPQLPDGGTSGAYYYQLGRVIWPSGATPQVVQDHTGGVVQFLWFANCYLG